MEKEELLEYLIRNIEIFNNVTYDDFHLLTSMEADQLAFMNKDVYRITPLLKQICNYAMIGAFLEETEVEELKKCMASEKEHVILINVLNLVTTCYQYTNLLMEEDCNHPSILNFENIINSNAMYIDMFDTVCELLENLDDQFKEDLIDLSDIVDENILAVIDSMWEKVVNNIKDNGIDSEKELLSILKNYVKNKATTTSLIKEDNVNYYDDCYIK